MDGRREKRSAPRSNNATNEDSASEAVTKGIGRYAPTDEDKNIVRGTVAGMIGANQKDIRVAKLVGALDDEGQNGTIAYAIAKQMETKHRRTDGSSVLKEVLEISQCKDEKSIKLAFCALNKFADEYIDAASIIAAAKGSGIQIDDEDVAVLEKLGGLTEEDMIQWLLDEEESG